MKYLSLSKKNLRHSNVSPEGLLGRGAVSGYGIHSTNKTTEESPRRLLFSGLSSPTLNA